MLWIRDILIRIRIRGSVPLIRLCIQLWILLFSSLNFKAANKNLLHLHIFSKIKSHKGKTIGIKLFLTVFAWWLKDPDPYLWQIDPVPDPGGPKTYGSVGSGSATLSLLQLAPFTWTLFQYCCSYLDGRGRGGGDGNEEFIKSELVIAGGRQLGRPRHKGQYFGQCGTPPKPPPPVECGLTESYAYGFLVVICTSFPTPRS